MRMLPSRKIIVGPTRIDFAGLCACTKLRELPSRAMMQCHLYLPIKPRSSNVANICPKQQ